MIGHLLFFTLKADAFRTQVLGAKEIRTPVKQIQDSTYFHVRHNNLYIVGVTKSNANAALVFELLHRVIEVMRSYFGGHLDEEAVRNNFVLIYELLDEVLDFGYPQVTSADLLKLYIYQQGVVSEEALEAQKKAEDFTIQATGAVGYRRDGIKYKRNEVFIDVVESVNLLVSHKGTVLRSDVSGQIIMKAYLSGKPECKFGLNDKLVLDKEAGLRNRNVRRGTGVEIDDVKFHQCVKLGKFDSDRTISFIPADGEFELMRYRCTDRINLPFKVFPTIKELGRTRLEFKITVKSAFSAKLFATNVVVKIPVPDNTADANITVSAGTAKLVSAQRAIHWKIKRMQGETDAHFAGEVHLIASTSEKKQWSRPPIEMEFQVPMFTASGLKVRFLKVFEKSNYQTTKWVRYVSKAGSYQHRISNQ